MGGGFLSFPRRRESILLKYFAFFLVSTIIIWKLRGWRNGRPLAEGKANIEP